MNRRLLIALGVAAVAGLGVARYLVPDKPPSRPGRGADAVPRQLERLRSPDAAERRLAAQGLALAGRERADEVVPPLVEALADADAEVRAVAVAGLADLAPLDRLRELARGADPDRRRLALLALGRAGKRGWPATPDVLAALGDGDARVRLAAALALRGLAPERAEPPPALRFADNFAGQWARFVFQGQVSGDFRATVRAFADGLTDPEPLVRSGSAAALEELAPVAPAVREARPALEAAFRDPAAGFPAAGALAQLARSDQGLADFLVAGLADPDPVVRRQSAAALGGMGTRAGVAAVTLRNRAAVDALLRLLGDRDERLRLSAASTLGQIGSLAAPAVPALVNLLDISTDARAVAVLVEALGRIGTASPLVVPVLLRRLPDDTPAGAPDPSEQALSRLGRDATSALLEGLSAVDPRVRRGAARSLGVLGTADPGITGPLERALGDADVVVRVQAARALWRLDPARSDALVPVLAACLAADLPTGRLAAAALEEIGPPAAGAVAALRRALASPDAPLRETAARALGRIGPLAAEAVPELAGLARGSADAVRALGAMGPSARAAVPELLELLKTRPDLPAAVALAAIDPNRTDGLAVLRAHVGDENLADRIDTWLALARLGPLAVEAAPALVERDSEGMGGRLPFVLARMGVGAVPVLKKALGTPHARGAACQALADLGPAAADAVPALTPLLREPKDRAAAVRTLAAMGPAGLPPLREALADARVSPELVSELEELPAAGRLVGELTGRACDGSPAVRRAACAVLGSIGPAARAALPSLRTLRGVDDPAVRAAVALAVARIDLTDRAAVPVLTDLLLGPDGPGRADAARALGVLGRRAGAAVPELKAVCGDRDAGVRAAALEGLAAVVERAAAPGVVPTLTRGLADRDEAVHRAAVRALGSLGPAAAPAVPALVRLVEGERPGARKEAVLALGRIGPAALPAVRALRELLTARGEHAEGEATARVADAARALWRIDPGREGLARALAARLQPALLDEVARGADRPALDALADLGPAAAPAVPALCRKLVSPFPEARARAAEVLGGIGPAAAAAAPYLDLMAGDADETVRARSRSARAKVGG